MKWIQGCFTNTSLVNLSYKCYDRFSSSNFDPVQKYWKYDVRFLFNEECDYSEENASYNEEFRSTIF